MSAFSMCQLLAESLDWAQSCHSSSLSQRLLRGSGCEAWQPPRNVCFTADTGSAGGACRIYEFTTLDRSYPSQRGPEGAVSKSSHLFSAPEQSRGQLSIDGNCVVPSPRSAEEREMASSAQICAGGHRAQERPGGKAAMRRSPLRHPPAELGGIRARNPLGADRARNRRLGKQSRFIERDQWA